MNIEKEYRLDLLSGDTVSVVTKQFITTEIGERMQVGSTSRRCYSNCPTHRQELQTLLPDEYYNAVIAVWGEVARFKDLAQPAIN